MAPLQRSTFDWTGCCLSAAGHGVFHAVLPHYPLSKGAGRSSLAGTAGGKYLLTDDSIFKEQQRHIESPSLSMAKSEGPDNRSGHHIFKFFQNAQLSLVNRNLRNAILLGGIPLRQPVIEQITDQELFCLFQQREAVDQLVRLDRKSTRLNSSHP